VTGRLMAQPVYPQLRKCPERSGTYASCEDRKLDFNRPREQSINREQRACLNFFGDSKIKRSIPRVGNLSVQNV
jgi:hypothetical protein